MALMDYIDYADLHHLRIWPFGSNQNDMIFQMSLELGLLIHASPNIQAQ